MSISTAFHNALSGLSAASRASVVVSDNIANALTPGYTRRSLEVATSHVTGNGVQVVGVNRHDAPVLTANRRSADAGYAHAKATSEFFSGLEQLVGTANDPNSITNKLTNFESSLISAASMPESATRLDTAVTEARHLANAINDASEGLRRRRSDADRRIGQQVDRLNTALKDVEDLNARLSKIRAAGGNVAALLDQRQVLVDEINEIVPVNIVARDNDRIALYSDGGAILLDDRAAELSFDLTGDTMPHMTVGNGLLSGLEINGRPVATSGGTSAIRGGSLAAQFEIRDELAIEAQQDLDALARDLIERFETPGLDPTVAATDVGLFTDDGSRFDPAVEIGLAGRLALNTVVDPDNGGDSWKLRAGLGATVPGAPGDARQLKAFGDALTTVRTLPTTRFGTGSLTAADISEGLLSRVGQDANTTAGRMAFASTTRTELERIEKEQGVDTDTELQRMMQIEQAYAANARIIETVDELMDTLLRL
ncbi:flagellar hook-associated protein FlgK [Ruegeria sp. HKCCD8929]|uniref:flagellar hook-associated protein FlgK n=1 Tax=Ruegeria sp. HKCCD8929 TaxID=2683006 RepID=UPI001489EE93|nr:flagellar hook-associated protein FlgK [Ruegeria sp. HKCCD8929]